MSCIFQSTHTFFRLSFAGALLLFVSGCANTGFSGKPGLGRASLGNDQSVPDFVRNLPKSRTGNQPEYSVFGRRYNVMDSAENFSEEGIASWYGEKFHGRKTSSGDVYDMHAMSAAHKHLPLPTFVRVTNLENNRSVVVKVNDRGPFVGGRIIDLSYAAAKQLQMADKGTANVHIEALSTHLISENEVASNKGVVQTFDNAQVAPEEVEPILAAVQPQGSADVIETFENEVEPTIEYTFDDNDDNNEGFVELVAKAAAAPTTQASELEQANDVQSTASNDASATGDLSAEPNDRYFIQLGAFGHAPNAALLAADVLKKTGLPAFVEQDNKHGWYRVKLGPYDKGDKLDTAMTELADIGVDGYTRPVSER